MSKQSRENPFGPPAHHQHLDAAPLVLVLWQIRWPTLDALQGDISGVVRRIGSKLSGFPLFAEQTSFNWDISPEAVTQTNSLLYQWNTPDRTESITFTQESISYSTQSYRGYEHFASRVDDALSALVSAVDVPIVNRIGFRYVNQMEDTDIDDLFIPASLGYARKGALPEAIVVEESLSLAKMRIDGTTLQVRSGILPSGQTLDPVLQPKADNTWVLDIDAFQEGEAPLTTEGILNSVMWLSDLAYGFLRHATTDAFAARFGGADADSN